MLKYFLVLFGVLLFIGCGSQKKESPVTEPDSVTDPVIAKLDKLNKDIKEDQDNPDLYHERAKFYLGNNEFNEALKDIVTALEIDSGYADYYVTLSDVHLAMGKLQKTVVALEKAINLDAEQTDAYLKLAEMSIVIRDYKKAVEYIDQALQVDELLAKAYFLRGLVMLENGDTVRGIRNFQKSVDVEQEYFDAHFQLGVLYAEKKNNLAIDYFNNALNIDPLNIDALYYLGMFYQETGEYDKAILKYNSLLDKNPEFYLAYFNIGYIHLVYMKDFETSIDYFSKAIEVNEAYVEAFYNRGFAYEMLKDVDRSRADYKKTLELHPNYDKAVAGLNRIDEFLYGQ